MPRKSWSRAKLLKLAQRLGMPGCNKMTRKELYEHLLDAYS